MTAKAKKQTKTTVQKTNLVMVTPELQQNNEAVMKAYTKIVQKATECLNKAAQLMIAYSAFIIRCTQI